MKTEEKQMRLKITKTKSATNYYIIKDIKKNGKRSTIIYERLGTEKEILERSNGEDIFTWMNNYIDELNKNNDSNDIIVKYSPKKRIYLIVAICFWKKSIAT